MFGSTEGMNFNSGEGKGVEERMRSILIKYIFRSKEEMREILIKCMFDSQREEEF